MNRTVPCLMSSFECQKAWLTHFLNINFPDCEWWILLCQKALFLEPRFRCNAEDHWFQWHSFSTKNKSLDIMISVLACKDTLSVSSFSNVAFRWTCQPTIAQWSRRNWSTPTAPPSVTGSTAGTSGPWSTHTTSTGGGGDGWVGGWWCKLAVNTSGFCVLEPTGHFKSIQVTSGIFPKHGCL